jgi:phosphoribosylglycinamide formyltransferase 1
MATIARACLERRIAASVNVVISDRPGVAGIDTARGMGIDTHVVPWKTPLDAKGARDGDRERGAGTEYGASDRAPFERALRQCIDSYNPGLVVLAGFMRVLSGGFVAHYSGRMLNIHPSLLPKYTGLHTHRRALDAGDKIHGATVHFVTAELDGGPLIVQSQVPVKVGDTESELTARVQATEHVIYPRAIEWIADGRLQWNDGIPLLDGKVLKDPVVEYFGAR